MGNGETREVAGVRIEATPSYDVTPGESFHPKGEANGYIVTLGGRRIYVVGVTECVPDIRAVKNIDVAFFPMNLPAARMEPDAAIECIKAINPKVVYPYHYDQVWVRPVPAGGTRPAPTTRGLQELVKALTPSEDRSASRELVPAVMCPRTLTTEDTELTENTFRNASGC